MRLSVVSFSVIFAAGLVAGWGIRPLFLSPTPPVAAVHSQDMNERSSHGQEPMPAVKVVSSARQTPSFVDLMRELLTQNNYREVVQLLHTIELVGDESLHRQLRNMVRKDALNSVQRGENKLAIALLRPYLDEYFDDVQALRWLGAAQLGQGAFMEGMMTLYSAMAYASRLEVLTAINQQIQTAVDEHVAPLHQKQAWHELLPLYEQLLALAPDNASYYLAMAKVHIAMKDFQKARETLEIIRHDASVADAVDGLFSQIEQQVFEVSVSQVGIPLMRRNGHYFVTAMIDHATEVTLLIDTGASITSLTPRALNDAGYSVGLNSQRRIVISTANGNVEVSMLSMDDFSIGNMSVSKLDVIALGMDEMPGVDGLLGMNYLKHFEFTIDQANDRLRLTPRNSFENNRATF